MRCDSQLFPRVVVAAAVGALAGAVMAAGSAPSPKEVLGLELGHDRVLASYGETRTYLAALAESSPRVRVVDIGTTVEGRPLIAAVISAPANLGNLAELKRGWARLADPRGLADAERDSLAARLPSCALIIAGIHSNEVAGSQSALLFAYRLAAAADGSREAGWLDHTVVLLVPSVNPDGQEAVVSWYRRTLATPAEGASPPFLYHRYAGHDNNRDFVFLTQPESRALNRFAYREWHPQVILDLHQMGLAGPRQFVPPFAEPLAPNVHPLVWRMTGLIGAWMSLRLEEAGKSGVVSGWMFDGNWIGGTRNTGWWKNTFGLLTETAGAALASPVYVDANELRAGGKGLREYRAQVNFPNPWPGGRWGLADAVGYQTELMQALVEFSATHGAELLRGVAAMAADASARGAREKPLAWAVRPGGPDPGRTRHLVNLLLEAGVEGEVADRGARADGVELAPGTVVFAAEQPLRQYLMEVMERQRYPEVALGEGGEIALPYDITAWTMPLFLGVDVDRVEHSLEGELTPFAGPLAPPPLAQALASASVIAVSASQLAGFAAANRALAGGVAVARAAQPIETASGVLPAGSFVMKGHPGVVEALSAAGAAAVALASTPAAARPLHAVRVGVLHPNTGLEDAGWCRWVLERGGFAVQVVRPAAVASGAFAREVDVLVVPPMAKKLIEDGPEQRLAEVPKEFQGGIGKDGVEALRRFVTAGGTVISFAAGAEWLAETVEAPVSNALKGVERREFFAPGALVEVAVDPAVELGWGMPERTAALVDAAVAFETRPTARPDGRVVAARFPDSDLLLSGWVRGEEKLRRRAAVVEVRRGEGRVVLFSFAPFFRGQTEGLFPLLYNAVALEMMDPPRRRE